MKAIVRRTYGSPEVLEYVDLDVPTPNDDQVLVKVGAVSLNSLDWRRMRGEPYLVRLQEGIRTPRNIQMGADVAGSVVAVGAHVTALAVGDEVFGMSIRTLAEYVVVSKDGLIRKPGRLTLAQAAAVPLAGLTAIQGLREGGLASGQRVLVTGASGGVGHFGVQVAVASGAIVTASCRTEHVAMVESLGASTVLDYTKVDITAGKYDLVLEAAGNVSIGQLKRMAPIAAMAGAPHGNWFGPLVKPIAAAGSKRLISFLAQRDLDDLRALGELVTPVIDSRYPLAETAAAVRHLETGHPGGKVLIDVV